MSSYWCLLLLVLHCCEVRGVIWSRGSERHQPSPQEISVQESLYKRGETTSQETKRVFKRQASSNSTNRTNIGFTAALTGDRHPHGLVHWTGFPSEVLFVLTRSRVNGLSRESWLWRSTDYGHSFINDTTKWDSDTVINWYYIAPLSEYLIFADITHRKLWVTRDEGATYSNYSIPFDPNRISFQSRLAPGSNSTTLAQYVLGYDSTLNQLWVSTNLGATWNRLGRNVTNYSWRVLSSAFEHNTAVYYEETMNATHSRLWNSTFPYTSSELFPNLAPFLTNSFVLSNEYMFVQIAVTSATEYSSPLWVSRNRQPFRQARFPLHTQELHYSVVDTSEGQVFIGVYHDINNTHLYLSEVEGVNYTLSLSSLVSPPESQWIQGVPKFDLHVVEGLVGTFIANTRDPITGFGTTVISYDKGGNWAQLRPPTLDRDGNFINCQLPNCSLHLYIQATRDTGYQSILTQDSAIGLIMAAGNLGSSLNTANSELRQYFSRDGGFTWLEVDSGFKQFQFAAQGAVVASVDVFQFTSSSKWSCDEGTTWEEVAFLEEGSSGVRVIGMLTEPGERAVRVTIFGIGERFVEWLVIDLNFSPVLPNQCTQHNFFTWVPTDDRPGSRCLLGESITYERRRASVCCFVDPGYNRLVSRTVCSCSLEDFECDFGFERIFLNSPCTPMEDFLWPPPQPNDCMEGHNYSISSGYRRVAGDKCVQGLELSYFPIERQCIVGAPNIIGLRINSVIITPGINVIFSIIQIEGGKIATTYHWEYNDTTSMTVIGYELGHQQNHTFALPGVYNVTILATNGQGSSFYSLAVTVVDTVSVVHIHPPSQLTSRKELPVDREVVFSSSLVTTYNTTLTGPVQYVWVFDGVAAPSNAATISHTFTSPATVTVTLNVLNAGTVALSTLTVNILDLVVDVNFFLPTFLLAGRDITFTSTFSTKYHTVLTGLVSYHWDFGTGNVANTTQSSFTHSFPMPGNYSIRLTAENNFSNSELSVEALVLDTVTQVVVTPPVHTIGGEVPATIPLFFNATISTRYNTLITGTLRYSWDFGDSSPATPPSSAAASSHIYTSDGPYEVTCIVDGPGGRVQGMLEVEVFEASDSSSVEIRSVHLIRGGYVPTQQVLTWRVESIEGSGHVIPPDTNFKWTVRPLSRSADVVEPSCPGLFTHKGSSPEYNLTLSCWGPYEVTVIGNHSAGSFVSQLHVTAEAAITNVMVTGAPSVLRSGGLAYLTLISTSQGSAPYEGPITLFIRDVNGTSLATSNVGGSSTLMVILNRDEASTPEKILTLQASNDVSSISVSASVILAVHGEYEALRFTFLTSLLPRNYKSLSFQKGLQEVLKSAVRARYLVTFHNILVEVEGHGFMINSSNSSSKLVARSSPQEVFYVDLNILPESLDEADIQAIRDVTPKIQSGVAAGSLSLTVQGSEVVVSSVDQRGEVLIVVEPSSTSTKLYIALGAGLGVGLILILAIAVILGVVVYIYRR